jgi:hypothetical protein
MATTGDTVTVPVKSSWYSKINWTQAIGVLASVGVIFGVEITPETQVQILGGIQVVQAAVTYILRTWFTKDVTAASV